VQHFECGKLLGTELADSIRARGRACRAERPDDCNPTGPESSKSSCQAGAVHTCTLSCPWHERGGNIAQRPEVWRSIAGGPNVIAGQRDMFPAEGCDVGKEIIGDGRAESARVLNGTMQVDGVPMDDRSGDEAQA
jgi:hypothetical protein